MIEHARIASAILKQFNSSSKDRYLYPYIDESGMLRFSENEDVAAKAELDRTIKAVNNNDSRLNIGIKRYSVGGDSDKNSA